MSVLGAHTNLAAVGADWARHLAMTRPWWWLVVPLAAAFASGPAMMRELASRAEIPEPDDGESEPGPLHCFEVTGPVLNPNGPQVNNMTLDMPSKSYRSCRLRLVDHVFANSYGKPFVGESRLQSRERLDAGRWTGNYTPPDCEFGKVIFNLTVHSEGRQYDRLATLWAGDVEVWRTSTAEPKPGQDIVWTHLKDMTAYLSLWKKPQTIMDLGNLVNERYTGSYNVTITATFFDALNIYAHSGPPADLVVPVSTRKSRRRPVNTFVFPEERAEAPVKLPRNIRRAVLSVAATGQAAEEFWWSNVPQEATDNFPNVTLPGLGSYREVRVRIDGHLVGLTWPFPVVFTGGIAPPLHRPAVGPQAFDLPEYEVDITPWVGLLCDGQPHNVSFEVIAEHSIRAPGNWLLSAKVFVWLSKPGSVSGGDLPRVNASTPSFDLQHSIVPGKVTRYRQSVNRVFYAGGFVRIDNVTVELDWRQYFYMDNDGLLTDNGDYQSQGLAYRQRPLRGGSSPLVRARVQVPRVGFVLDQEAPQRPIQHDARRQPQPGSGSRHPRQVGLSHWARALIPKLQDWQRGVQRRNWRHGRAFFYQRLGGDSSGGFGRTFQIYSLVGRGQSEGDPFDFERHLKPQLYSRHIEVVNETVVTDQQLIYMPHVKVRLHPEHHTRFHVEDQYAPILTDAVRGGSYSFSGKHIGFESPDESPLPENKSEPAGHGRARNASSDSPHWSPLRRSGGATQWF